MGVTVVAVASVAPERVAAMHATGGPVVPVVEGRNLQVTIRGSAGALWGEANERVYEEVNGRRYKLSELNWDLKGLSMGGAVGSVCLFQRLRVNAGVWLPMNKGAGGWRTTTG